MRAARPAVAEGAALFRPTGPPRADRSVNNRGQGVGESRRVVALGVVPAQRRRACRHAGLRGPTEAARIGRSRRPASHTRPALPRTPGCRIGPKGPAGLPRPGGQSAGQAARGAAGADAPGSVVAVDALHALVALLRLDRQGGDRARLQPAQADRLAGFLAVAVGAVLDAPQRLVDLGDQLAGAVAGAQFQRPVGLRRWRGR